MSRPNRPASPGPVSHELRPTTAERARTVAGRPGAAVRAAGVDGSRVPAHATTASGQVLLVVSGDGAVADAVAAAPDGDLAALVLVSDHAPVPMRDPVRAQVWLSGWLTAVPPADLRAATLAFADVAPVGALLDRDLRVPFSAPVSGAEELGPAVHRLLCAARGHDCPGR